jgi:hypothetical protein
MQAICAEAPTATLRALKMRHPEAPPLAEGDHPTTESIFSPRQVQHRKMPVWFVVGLVVATCVVIAVSFLLLNTAF